MQRPSGWEWTRWLPHVDGDAVAAQVVIVDGAGPAARLDGAAGIVLAPDVLALPSCCTHVVTVGPDADLSLLDLATGVMVDGVVGAGASVATAAGVARALARYDDPELLRPGGDLPRAVDLSRAARTAVRSTARRWRRRGPRSRPIRPCGRRSASMATARSSSIWSTTGLTPSWPARPARARASCCARW